MLKAAVFDIDNTLTHDVSWLRITELLGASVATHEDIFRRFSAGELPYDQAKSQLITLWSATGKAQKSHWEALFQDWPLVDAASDVVNYVHTKGYETAIITGSMDVFAASVARKLRITRWYANTATVWSATGQLLDFHYVKDQAAQKLTHLNAFCDEIGIEPTACAAVGDGDNDVELFRATGHGLAVGQSNATLQAASWKRLHSLSEVMNIL